jgi:hypothetical protein
VNFRVHPALVVALVLATCASLILGLAYFRGRRASTVSGLASFLPPEEGVVLAVDLAALRQAGMISAVAGPKVDQEPEYASFVRDTGFDYQADLDYALAWFGQNTTCMLLRGRFDWEKLRGYALSQQGSCRNSFCRMEGSTPERRISFFPLSRSVMALAVGADEWAASRLAAQKPSRKEMIFPNRPVWLLVPGAALKDPTRLPAGTRLFAKAIEGADQILLGLSTATGGLAVELDVTCRSPEDAATLSFQLQGVTRLLKDLISREKQSPNPGDLSGVLAAGVFNRVDRKVLGRWPVSQPFLESILRDSQ